MSVAPFKILNVVGARPNMMKIAPIIAEMRRHADLLPRLVHTGQHYDFAMSQVFLEQLNLGDPDYNLQVGSGTHHVQTAEVMRRFGELVQNDRPDLIVVAGDVNSTMACALVGAKECIPVAHVESGLRSFDRTMPEEINRLVTDSIAELLFTTEESSRENLLREGVPDEKIHFTGNVMIDSLVCALESARKSQVVRKLGLQPKGYIVLTLHRPSNVDDRQQLYSTLQAISQIARDMPVIFPVHPRTCERVAGLHIANMSAWNAVDPIGNSGILTIPPASYLDFLCLVDSSAMVITDSGGVQEETTYLGVPCLTFRKNTERPVTVTLGTNRLIGTDPAILVVMAKRALIDGRSGASVPPLWDGHAAGRIVAVIRNYLAENKAVTAATATGS